MQEGAAVMMREQSLRPWKPHRHRYTWHPEAFAAETSFNPKSAALNPGEVLLVERCRCGKERNSVISERIEGMGYPAYIDHPVIQTELTPPMLDQPS